MSTDREPICIEVEEFGFFLFFFIFFWKPELSTWSIDHEDEPTRYVSSLIARRNALMASSRRQS